MSLVEQVRSITQSVLDTIEEARAHLREKTTARETVRRAARPIEEVDLRAWVDRRAAHWLDRHGKGMIFAFLRHGKPPGAAMPGLDSASDALDLLCVGDADRVVALLARVLHQSIDATGVDVLTTEARTAQLDALNREVADLEAADERAVDEALAAGLTVAHLPTVLRRREEAAHADAKRKRRQELEAALDAQVAQAAQSR